MLNFTAILAAAFWQAKRFDDLKDLMRSEIGRVEGGFKSDLARVEGGFKSDLARVEGGFKSDLARVEGELRADLARVEGVLGTKIDGLAARVKALEDEKHSPLVKR